ncbi:MAG: chromate transporter [Ruminococcaceae bacterium]|nr:chromate transporter [Oscillospiraceae bacterium]
MIFLELFLTFLKIGAFTFGGGYAMLPLIQEAVLARGWIDETSLINFIAVSESTPGPFAINMATYVGSEVGGDYGLLGTVFGSFCATLGVVLPSFVIILIVAKIYDMFKKSKIVKGCMTGLKPAVIGLIGAAIVSVAQTVFVPTGFSLAIFASPLLYVSLCISAGSLVMAFKKVHPIVIICISAAIGIATGYIFEF